MKPVNTKIVLPDPTTGLTEEGRIKARFAARAYPRKTITFKGRNLRLYSIAWLAHMSGKSTRALHRWDNLGKMPTPLFLLNDSVRWYTAAELHGYSRLIKAANIRMGRIKKGEITPLDWFHSFALKFRADLKKLLESKLGQFPEALSDEDKMIEALSSRQKFNLTPSEIARLIK